MAREEAAMMQDDAEVGVEASPGQPKQVRRGVWMGLLVAAVMGTMVAVKVSMPQPLTPRQRVSLFHKHLVQAFSKRALQDSASLSVEEDFLLNAVDAKDPDAMGITAHIKQGEDQEPKMFIVLNAFEGKGPDLADALKEIVEAVDPGMLEMVEFASTDDEATLTILVPDEMDNEEEMDEEGEMSEMEGAGFKPPTLDFQFNFGHTSEEMVKLKDTNLLEVLNGFKIHLKANLQTGMYKQAPCKQGSIPEIMACEAMNTQMDVASTFQTVKSAQEIRYATGDKFSGRAFQNPGWDFLKRPINMVEMMGIMMFPPFLQKPLLKLDGLINGVKSAHVVGLEENQEVSATFNNFKIFPFMKMIAESAKGPGGPEQEE